MQDTGRNNEINCPLCTQKTSEVFFQEAKTLKNYWNCGICGLIFLDPAKYLSLAEEKAHYLTHNNDVNDLRYQEFVAELVDFVRRRVSPLGTRGLDYGSGTGPVVTKLLTEEGYKLDLYDPLFSSFKLNPDAQYDFIVSCEVVEHFHKASEEFLKLKRLLKKGAPLVMKTQPYESGTDFPSWFYRRDPTHVVFYRPTTFEWIKENFAFQKLERNTKSVFVLWN